MKVLAPPIAPLIIITSSANIGSRPTRTMRPMRASRKRRRKAKVKTDTADLLSVFPIIAKATPPSVKAKITSPAS